MADGLPPGYRFVEDDAPEEGAFSSEGEAQGAAPTPKKSTTSFSDGLPPGYRFVEEEEETPTPEPPEPPDLFARAARAASAAIPDSWKQQNPSPLVGPSQPPVAAGRIPTRNPLDVDNPAAPHPRAVVSPTAPTGDVMFEDTIPNEPVVSNIEDVWKHAPGPRGPLLSPEAKAGLAAQPKNVSAFAGVPAGQPVTTSGPGLVGGLQQGLRPVTDPLAAAAEVARRGLAPGVEMAQDIGKQVAGPLGPQGAQAAGAATGQVAEIIGQMATDPTQIAIMAGMGGLPAAAGKALLTVFMAQGAKGSADAVTDLAQNWGQYTPEERGKRLGAAVTDAAMVVLPAAGMARGKLAESAAQQRWARGQAGEVDLGRSGVPYKPGEGRTAAYGELGLPEDSPRTAIQGKAREILAATHPEKFVGKTYPPAAEEMYRRTAAARDFLIKNPPDSPTTKKSWTEHLDEFLRAPIQKVEELMGVNQPLPPERRLAPEGGLALEGPDTVFKGPEPEPPAPERAAPPPEPPDVAAPPIAPPAPIVAPEPFPVESVAKTPQVPIITPPPAVEAVLELFQPPPEPPPPAPEAPLEVGPPTELARRAELKRNPLTEEEIRLAKEEENVPTPPEPSEAAQPSRLPEERPPAAESVGGEAPPGYVEVDRPGEGIPEPERALEEAEPAAGAPGGRAGGGAEDTGGLTPGQRAQAKEAFRKQRAEADKTVFKAEGYEAHVVETRDGHFNVGIVDTDSGLRLPTSKTFLTREKAEAHAEGLVRWWNENEVEKAPPPPSWDHEKDQAAYRKQKAGLTRALNAKDWSAVLSNVEAFDKHWEGRSPPDDWARWERAKEDAQRELARGETTLPSAEALTQKSSKADVEKTLAEARAQGEAARAVPPPGVHPEALRKFDEAFAANDVDKLTEYTDKNNPGLRKLFTERTGMSLPKLSGSRKLSIKEWADHRHNAQAPEKTVAPPPPKGYILEGEQDAAPLEPADQGGPHGKGAVEEARAEAVRGPGEEREAPQGLAHGARAGEGAVREGGSPGRQPARGAEVGPGEPPQVRPGERSGEGAALGGGRGAGQRGAGNEETPIAAGAERGGLEPGRKEVPEAEGALESHPTSSNSGTDFRYGSAEDAEAASAGGARSRVSANIEALRILETVKAERRPATTAEQAVLAKFSGWGSFPGLFRYGSDLEDQGDIVRKLIGEDAWEAARASTLNAHYTAPQIVSAMWDAAKRLGLKGGRILEPSLGIGNFFALMPPEIRGRGQLTGVELDTSTGEMAKLLYPNANVEVKGFQDLKVPDGFYDFAISNVPFGDYRVHDKEYNKYPANIHDYFFLKSLDKVRPGGVVAFITSTGTMDKAATRVREAMIEKGADLVAAIRLPAETFQKTAGTSVVTDIIFLKKRAPGEPPSGPAWTKTVEFPDPDGKAPIPLNEYFAANPQQVLGRLDRSGTMYRGEQVNVKRLPDFEEKFRAAIERLPEKIIEPRKASSAFDPKLIQSAANAQYGSSVVQNGKLYVSLGDVMREVASDPATVSRVEKMLAIRDQVRSLYDAQLSDKGNAAIQEARQKLGGIYDAFVQKHGPISSAANLKPIWDDPDTPYILRSLERIDPKTKKVTKTDIFTKDTVATYKKAEHATSAGDAVSISLRERGNLDIEEMAKLLGRTEAEVGKDLVSEGLAYDDPKDGWTEKSLYLSGNVRRKLLEARAAAKVDPRYAANLEPLEQAQPKDLDFTEIYAPVGAPWIPEADLVDFMQHLIGGQPHDFKADYDPTQGHWYVRYTDRGKRHQGLAPDTKLWGTDRLGFTKLMESAANGQHPAVRDPHPTEEGKTVVNVEATAAANQKVDDIKRAFEDWVWDEPERRTRLHRHYNDNFNNLKRTDYDASHYKDAEGNYHFPGMNPAISLRPHQANFVWQAVSTGRGLAGHEVGTGKTMVEAAVAMEWRRLGLSKKPIITVPDSVIAGFADEFRKLYPAARIIVTGSGLDAKERRETLAHAASGDWDAVLMTHDNLDKLTMRPEVTKAYIEEQLDDLRAVKLAAHEKDPKKDNRIVKALEKAELRLEAKLKDLIEGKTEKDRALYFEELGGDSLIVDEAHVYKSLPVYTAMENLKGVPGQESQRATNMLMRTRWLQQQNSGRGVVFATGTPIDNSLAELYNMQRYLQFNELKERGIQSFDAWARTFATEQSQMEMKATGDYAMETRLSSFVNVPDLQALSGVVTDVKRATDMGDIVRPHRTDELVTVPMSDLGRQYLDVLRRRAEAIRKRGRLGKGEHGDTFLAITNDAAEAATDIRRVAPGAPDEPGSKVNALVRKVLEIHKENPGKTQLIFSDRGVHETARGGHSTYKDIIRKLVKGGIPAAKIINFSDLGKGGKEEAVARVKSGDALVAIGGSKTLGTGVNVQDKLIAVHHLDCPWTPARLEQRNGRIWRQGNENTHIRIIPYVTEGSFDANMWEAVNRKSKFIAQFMDGKFKGRSFEDPDAEKLSYAQIMAKASGSPELLEKINMEEQVKKFERAKRQHKKVQAELQDSLKNSANMADYHRKRIATWEAAAQRLATPRGKFSVEVGGKVYDEPKAAGEAMAPILAAAEKASEYRSSARPMEPIPLAVYRGEPIEMAQNFGATAPFVFDGTKTLSMEAGNPSSILNSFDGVARSLPAYIAQEKASLAAIEQAAEKAKAEIGKPFKDEERLATMQKRLPELEQIVKQKMEAAKKAREGQAVDPLLAEAISKTMEQHPEAAPASTGPQPLNPKAFYRFIEGQGYVETKGRKLDLPEDPNHEYFLHKNHHGAWVVSEAKSGLSLGIAENTQLAATGAARKRMAEMLDKINTAVGRHVEKHGPSPRHPAEYKAFQEGHPHEPEGEPEPMVKGEDGVYRVAEKKEPESPSQADLEEIARRKGPVGPMGAAGPAGPKQRTTMAPKTGAPVGAADIIAHLSKLSGTPIRYGHGMFGLRKVSGWFNPENDLIRMRNASDIDTAAHEVGHSIDRKIRGGNFKKLPLAARADLQRLGKKLYGSRRPEHGYMREGWAEYVAQRLRGENVAASAPDIHKWFENEFLPKQPELEKGLSEAQLMFDEFDKQGAAARVASQIHNISTTPRGRLKNAWERVQATGWRQMMTNDAAPLEDAVAKLIAEHPEIEIRPDENPKIVRAALLMGAKGTARYAVFDGTVNLSGHKTGDSLAAVLKPVKDDLENFTVYAYSKHALSVHARGKNPGISKADAEYVVETMETPAFLEASKGGRAWSGRLIDSIVEAGGLSPGTREALDDIYPFWVSLKRYFDESYLGGSGGGAGKGSANLGSAIKRLKGSGRQIVNPLESFVQQAEHMMILANKLQVGRAVIDFAEKMPGSGWFANKVPTPKEATSFTVADISKDLEEAGIDLGDADLEQMVTVFQNTNRYFGKDNIVSIWRDGKREFWELHPDVYRTITEMDKDMVLPWLLTAPKRLVQLGATGVSAGFSLISNPLRDAMTWNAYEKGRHLSPLGAFTGLWDELQKDPAAQQWKALGGELGTLMGQDRMAAKRHLEEALAEGFGEKAWITVKHPIDGLRQAFGIFESGPRVATFKTALQEAEKKWGVGSRAAAFQAMFESKDVTVNFTRMGTISRAINQMVPFFNAKIQGASKFYRTFGGGEGGGQAGGARARTAMNASARAFAWITVPSLLLWYANKDEDWYKELKPWEKGAFWVFSPDHGKHKYRIPKPQELGYVFGSVPEALMDRAYRKNTRGLSDALWQTMDSMLPFNLSQGAAGLMDVLPAAVKPMVEYATNYDSFRNRKIIDAWMEERKMPKDQYHKYTTAAAIAVGQLFNVSPAKIEHVVSGYTGGTGLSILQGIDLLVGHRKAKAPTELADVPVLSRFAIRNAPGVSVDDLYERESALAQKRGSKTLSLRERVELRLLDEGKKSISDVRHRIDQGRVSREDGNAQITKIAERALRHSPPGVSHALPAPEANK